MNIDITAKYFELTPSIRDFTEEKVNSLTRFYGNITEAKVILEIDKGHHKHGKVNGAKIIIRVPEEVQLVTQSWTNDMHKSINEALETMQEELKRYKGKHFGLNEEEIRKAKGNTGEEEE